MPHAPQSSEQPSPRRVFREYNFDGLVGPTHNYAGLGTGNLASMASKHHVSSPRKAALEGLAKMKLVAELGVPQAILPPQRRPHVGYLRARYGSRTAGVPPAPDPGRRQDACGTSDRDTSAEPVSDAALEAAIECGSAGAAEEPWFLPDRRPAVAEVAELLRRAAENGEAGRRDLAIATSASAMWTANAATVSPSPDTDDVLCVTPANLASQPHRALEATERHRVFSSIFSDRQRFWVGEPLPAELPDEGGANHTRLCPMHQAGGVEVFSFGRRLRKLNRASPDPDEVTQFRFVPRQAWEASEKLIELHGLDPVLAFTVKQSRAAVDAGVFHNDVICVGNESVLLIHEKAWERERGDADPLEYLQTSWGIINRTPLDIIHVRDAELPLPDAVRSYLFNSQFVTLPDGSMALIHPSECDEVPTARAAIDRILREDNPVQRAISVDVRQSMKNGGGPACLRLRVVLSDEEKAAVRGNVFWTPELHETLEDWINRHYRETLTPQDLADPRLYEESMAALDELAEIMELPI